MEPVTHKKNKSILDLTALAVNLILAFFMVVIFAYGEGFEINAHQFGLHPRDMNFWYTALSSAFLHGDYGHLFSNLSTQMLFGYLL